MTGVGGGAEAACAASRRLAWRLPSGYGLLVLIIVLGFVGVLAVVTPYAISQDTWLAVLAGRLIAHSGVPHRVTLTAIPYGHVWHDEQWLAQLVMYELVRVGGLALLGLVQVAVAGASLWAATRVAMRLGSEARAVLPVILVAAVCVALFPAVRAQAYGYPLFVAIVWLLARDSRARSRAVFACLPILILWGNLHGAATLGAGLVMLRGLTTPFDAGWRGERGVRSWVRGVVLLLGPLACLLITPYGLGMVPYYHATLLNPAFRQYVTEWQPVTASAIYGVPTFLLAGIAIWAFGRYPRAAPTWDRWALLALSVGAVLGIRNVVWLGLGMAMLLPVAISPGVRAARAAQGNPRLDRLLAVVVAAALVFVLVRTAVGFDRNVRANYPPAAVPVVRAATRTSSVRVFADERFADWLMWRLPDLQGREAFDASFELLTARQLGELAAAKAVTGPDWQRGIRGYRLFVLDTAQEPALVRELRGMHGVRMLFHRDGLEVLER